MKFFISPSRLKKLREQNNLTLANLAKMSAALKRPVTARTISDIEKDKNNTRPIHQNKLLGLANALGVNPKVLSGEQPLPEKPSPSDPISVQLDAQTRLNYELIERRYNVSLNDIVNIAPILFIKAAMESMSRQKSILEREVYFELGQTLEPGEESGRSLENLPDGLLQHWDDEQLEHRLGYRIEAVKQNDLFDQTVPIELNTMSEEKTNPFADYLIKICASEIGHEMAKLKCDDFYGFIEYFPGHRIPQSRVCDKDIERITLGSYAARRALVEGVVRIKDIPDDLWEPRKAGDRVAWLEDEYASANRKDELNDTGEAS